MKYLLFSSSILCICYCASFGRVNFSSFTKSPWNLSLHIGETTTAISKWSIQRSVGGKLRHYNCHVLCGDISDVCYVASVTVCVH